ncbi:hypothetical protein CEXT_655921 [Caerostris extrusa]|uniref:Uncharacterized protein n=1 Tax=Caerostris extrusa TaxID=172846 RepID=A0AAV4QQJ7_CAEEX|nr:hypothetical protein CEXT_655921 [Caerostris extrusa]
MHLHEKIANIRRSVRKSAEMSDRPNTSVPIKSIRVNPRGKAMHTVTTQQQQPSTLNRGHAGPCTLANRGFICSIAC